MLTVRQTHIFREWLSRLRDERAKAKILVRVKRLSMGNPGDVKPVGHGISEIRIPDGKGYRVYFTRRGDEIVLLLCGGHKGTQRSDIETARLLALNTEYDNEN